ncbi:MAG: ferritin family protein [Lachnospiraceae bacterium]
MAVDFRTSETSLNLMRAFAGESQAKSRYTIFAEISRDELLPVIEYLFQYTAAQEGEHARLFYNYLAEFSGEMLPVDGDYPVNISLSVPELLRMAQHTEYEEYDMIYSGYGQVAEEEGFPDIAYSFRMVAEIERYHGDRFGKFADLMETDRLFTSPYETVWTCLNCGHIYRGTDVPPTCPVCHRVRGFYIRLDMAPFQD